jgi:hypothetical protein
LGSLTGAAAMDAIASSLYDHIFYEAPSFVMMITFGAIFGFLGGALSGWVAAT